MDIKKIKAREILDSRGCPTVECLVTLTDDTVVSASVPSGASVGLYEAVEKRDGDINRFLGKGVLHAVTIIEKELAPILCGQVPNIFECDAVLNHYDGTKNKSRIGANTTLAVSMAVFRAQAYVNRLHEWELFSQLHGTKPCTPTYMANVINGGCHAYNGLAFQEYMIVPRLGLTAAQQGEYVTCVYHALKELLKKQKLSIGVGDEGGFAPTLTGTPQEMVHRVFELLLRAIQDAGFEPGKDIFLALDVAASELYEPGGYQLGRFSGIDELCSSGNLITWYRNLCTQYPLISIEDGYDQTDWEGWSMATQRLGEAIQLVGDDIFVTNVDRLQRGVEERVANAILIKLNQVGTVSETLQTIKFAQDNNYVIVISHRSGETNDYFMADLAVGVGAEYIKLGAPCRGERIAKYNRLSEIGFV